MAISAGSSWGYRIVYDKHPTIFDMKDISKLIDLDKDMGFKGSELADFVNEKEW